MLHAVPFIPTSGDQGIIKAITESRPRPWERWLPIAVSVVSLAVALYTLLR